MRGELGLDRCRIRAREVGLSAEQCAGRDAIGPLVPDHVNARDLVDRAAAHSELRGSHPCQRIHVHADGVEAGLDLARRLRPRAVRHELESRVGHRIPARVAKVDERVDGLAFADGISRKADGRPRGRSRPQQYRH